MTKSTLRKHYLEKRQGLAPVERTELSIEIINRFFDEIEPSSFNTIHTFISMKHAGEVETGSLFKRLWLDYPQVRTFAPRVNKATGEIDSILFTGETKLVESRWKIPEPSEGEIFPPHKLDLVIVPLICFDQLGFRVGYGKGFYDRFLAKCRPDCRKVGFSFFPPVDRIDDVYEGDVALDYCVTAERLYKFGMQRRKG